MQVELWIYKRYDTDILALWGSGLSIPWMIKQAVEGYANDKPVHFFVPECKYTNLSEQQRRHTCFNTTDSKTISLLKGIKRGYRNSFCKMILRNALIVQNLCVYFEKPELIAKESERLKSMDTTKYSNLVVCTFNSKENKELLRKTKEKVLKKEKKSIKDRFMETDVLASDISVPVAAQTVNKSEPTNVPSSGGESVSEDTQENLMAIFDDL